MLISSKTRATGYSGLVPLLLFNSFFFVLLSNSSIQSIVSQPLGNTLSHSLKDGSILSIDILSACKFTNQSSAIRICPLRLQSKIPASLSLLRKFKNLPLIGLFLDLKKSLVMMGTSFIVSINVYPWNCICLTVSPVDYSYPLYRDSYIPFKSRIVF